MVRESAIDILTVYGIDYTDMSFHLLSRECTEEHGHVGKYRDRYRDLWKDQDVILMFYLYACLFTASLIYS